MKIDHYHNYHYNAYHYHNYDCKFEYLTIGT